MGDHAMRNGVCMHCGCDAYAIDYFGWTCSGRTIRHEYQNGVCTNCGFSRQVIEHFDWPCRIETSQATPRPNRPKFTPLSQIGRRFAGTSSYKWKQERPSRRAYMCEALDDETRFGRLLGLKGKVTRSEIKLAYREQACLYHPDRVAHLGPEFQELANEKMKEINKAFAFFQRKYNL